MVWELFPKPRTRKEKKRAVLDENKRKGQAAEDQFVWEQRMRGNEVERTGRASDYKVRRVNILTGEKGRAKVVDVKSSKTAKLSQLQRKKRAKKVVVEPFLY